MEHELTVLCRAMVDAGKRALRLADTGFEVYTKPDHSPVTSVDLEVNRLLEAALRGTFPEDGWLSEESPDSAERLSKARVWVIDPIDGTKAFIKRRPTFVISAALVQDGHPLVGAIYNPSTEELFSAVRGHGARLNGHLIRANAPPSTPFPLLVNSGELDHGRFRALGEAVACQSLGSIAYSLALVAAGRAPAMLTLEREYEWDVAAATVLIQEAGGWITNGAGAPFSFNQAVPQFRGTIAVSSEARKTCEPLVARLRGLSASLPS